MIPVRPATNLVLFQHKVKVSGDWNPVVSWVEFRQAWVSIMPNRGREVFQGDELASVITHTIRGDFLELEGVNETMRIVYNDTHDYDAHGIRADSLVFDILAVMPEMDFHADTMIQANLKALRFGQLPPDVPQ